VWDLLLFRDTSKPTRAALRAERAFLALAAPTLKKFCPLARFFVEEAFVDETGDFSCTTGFSKESPAIGPISSLLDVSFVDSGFPGTVLTPFSRILS
jgi:hypothetical protein